MNSPPSRTDAGAPARPTVIAAQWALPALLTGALCIALSPILVRLSELGPTATAFWRVAFSLPLLGLWVALKRRRAGKKPPVSGPRITPDHLRLTGLGIFFAVDLTLWHWSITLTTVANATLLANMAPIFVTLAGWALFAERFRAGFLLGLALAVIGAGVLMGASLTISRTHLVGDALGLGAAIFYGAYVVAVGRLRARFSTATVMTWSGAVSAAILAPLAWLSGEGLIADSAIGWLDLVALALICQAIGVSLIAFALAHLSAALGSVSLLLQPVAAAFLAWIIFAERLGVMEMTGAVAVLIGIFVANRARSPRMAPKQAVRRSGGRR